MYIEWFIDLTITQTSVKSHLKVKQAKDKLTDEESKPVTHACMLAPGH